MGLVKRGAAITIAFRVHLGDGTARRMLKGVQLFSFRRLFECDAELLTRGVSG